MLALLSGKIDKYKYLTDEEILPSDLSKIIEQAKLHNPHSVKQLKNKQKQLKIKE